MRCWTLGVNIVQYTRRQAFLLTGRIDKARMTLCIVQIEVRIGKFGEQGIIEVAMRGCRFLVGDRVVREAVE